MHNKCKDCLPRDKGGDRYPGCQDHCRYGVEDRIELDARNDKIRKAKKFEREYRDFKVGGVERVRRRLKKLER